MIDRMLFKLKGMKKLTVFLTCATIFQSLATILQAKYLAVSITHLFNGEKLSLQLVPITLFLTFFMLRELIILVREKQMKAFAGESGRNLREQFMKQLYQLGPNATVTGGTGHIVTLAQEGILEVKKYIELFIPKIISMALIPLFIFIYTFYLDARSGIVLLLVLPTMIFFMVILGYAAKRKANNQYKSYQTLSNHFVDSLRGLETLRLLGLSKDYVHNIEKVSERYRLSTMATLKFAFLSSFALDFFSSLSVAIVALFLGLSLIAGEMTLLPALTILILAPEYFVAIREFGGDYHATLNGKNALKALNDFISTPVHQLNDTNHISKWDGESTLEVKKLNLQYEDSSKSALKNIKFCIKGYGKIGIIGASGCGKSTLINVLTGFLNPTEASIKMNGEHVSSFKMKSWQEQMVYIPQHPYVFNDTVRNNISFYSPNASNHDIEVACEQAGLSDLIKKLSNGIEEEIGESGTVLSGGQEQRIALARAFLDKERKIVLFDEPTAHLDIETEWELKQHMLSLFENRLVFLATHRLHWMKEMDQILVLRHGEIVEVGSHEELLQANGYYKELVQAQMGVNM